MYENTLFPPQTYSKISEISTILSIIEKLEQQNFHTIFRVGPSQHAIFRQKIVDIFQYFKSYSYLRKFFVLFQTKAHNPSRN